MKRSHGYIEFVVDTGFTGMLTHLPKSVRLLNLDYLDMWSVKLADGTYVDVPVHLAEINWHGTAIRVRELATGDRPPLGAALLDGYELSAVFREGDIVTIEKL